MSEAPDLSADTIRNHLLARVEAFAKARNMSVSAIGKAAVQDDRIIARVRAGENFTVKTYQRIIDWLDAQEAPAQTEGAAA